MAHGLPYDSDDARMCAAAITAVMTGEAYAQSARIARDCGGPFSGYAKNAEPFLRVMRKHRDALDDADLPPEQHEQIRTVWDEAISVGEAHGFRNAQASVLAPTGTISFLMDCDTTGVEPDIALVKYKHLVGGGTIRIVNRTVPRALSRLGYDDKRIEAIVAHIDEHGTIEGAPHLDPDHLPVFDCADRPAGGTRSIHHTGHLKMVAAVQPFISGAISKTVNLPNEATVDDIEETYLQAWRLGAKSVSVYRNGSKRTQPLNTGLAGTPAPEQPQPVRRKLPDERQAIIHKFDITGYKGYITVGLFDDGSPGEMFLVMSKEGSTIYGVRRLVRPGHLLRAAVRRAAADPGRQVQPRPVRAGRPDEEPRRAHRQVDRRLRLPLDGDQVPLPRGAVPRRGQQAPGDGNARTPRPSAATRPNRQPPGQPRRRLPPPRRRPTTRTRRHASSAGRS